MTQINTLRTDNNLNPIERDRRVDELAEFIYYEFEEDFFSLLEKMDLLELSGQGQFPVFWELSLNSSVVEQINLMEESEKGLFVNPEVKYWGGYTAPETNEYMLVLILYNPLFQQADSYAKNGGVHE